MDNNYFIRAFRRHGFLGLRKAMIGEYPSHDQALGGYRSSLVEMWYNPLKRWVLWGLAQWVRLGEEGSSDGSIGDFIRCSRLSVGASQASASLYYSSVLRYSYHCFRYLSLYRRVAW